MTSDELTAMQSLVDAKLLWNIRPVKSVTRDGQQMGVLTKKLFSVVPSVIIRWLVCGITAIEPSVT